MDATGPTTFQRVAAVLRAKQHMVFFAISLSVFTTAVPLIVSWARDDAPFAGLLDRSPAVLYDAAQSRALWLAAAVALYLLVFTWFRAGYLRSLVGRFHLRPQDGAQFLRLLALEIAVETLGALSVWSASGGVGTVAAVVGLALFLANLALLYADYAIVISALGPVRAVSASLTCLRRNPGLSFAVVLAAVLFQWGAFSLLHLLATGSLARSLPVLVVYVVLLGVATFVADVILIVVYLKTTEGSGDRV